MSIGLRFAMDTWRITYQDMVPATSCLLAKEMANLLTSLFDGLASIHQVACCSVNGKGLFNLYVKFDWAPEPSLATKILSRACIELNGLHFEVYDPLNFLSYVKLPYDMNADDVYVDYALQVIRQNIPKLTTRVSKGMDVHVEQL